MRILQEGVIIKIDRKSAPEMSGKGVKQSLLFLIFIYSFAIHSLQQSAAAVVRSVQPQDFRVKNKNFCITKQF